MTLRFMSVYMSDRCQREGAHAVMSSFREVGVLEPCCTRFFFSELKVVFQKMPFHRRNIFGQPCQDNMS